MIFTVTTVKDTMANVERFVTGNLAGGVDHLVVMLDAPDAPDQVEVRAWLEAHPHVTCVGTDDAWWAGDRPAQLNVRQRVNANLAKSVLAGVPDAAWLFHIDGDEIVQLDPAALAEVPADLDAVQLDVWETASQYHWEREPHLFKRMLGEDDLALLHALGSIPRPNNGVYFHGHVEGKCGVRPTAEVWITLHKAVTMAEDRERVPAFSDERLVVLHYESYSGEEFVRKWLAMIDSGPKASFRPARGDTASALRTLVEKGLPPERLEPYLRKVYADTTEDDVTTLLELGLLVDLDPRDGAHVPQALSAAARATIESGLAELRTEPKRRFTNAQAFGEARAAEAAGARRRRMFGR